MTLNVNMTAHTSENIDLAKTGPSAPALIGLDESILVGSNFGKAIQYIRSEEIGIEKCISISQTKHSKEGNASIFVELV